MKALWLVLAVGCADNTVTVSPIIDVPANDSASAFPLDQLVLSVAEAGSSADLVSQTFAKGAQVSLPGVPFGNDLVIHMTGRVGTSEIAYGRTCTITIAADGTTPPSPHLFFAREVKFADLDLTLQPESRQDGTAITDVAGAGLILGGVDPGTTTPNGEIERFDPQTGELRLLASPPEVTPRVGAVAASLGVGGDTRIALIGGTANGSGATFIELVQPDGPAGRRVDRVDDTQMARSELTATALTDGRLIAIGGRDGTTPSNAVDEVTIDNGTATVRVLRATLATPRYAHTATRLGDDVGAPVLVSGGLDFNGAPVALAELFKPLGEKFADPGTFMPKLNVPRYHHQAVRMPDGSVLIIGGIDADNQTGVDELELFTLDGGFVNVGKLPTNAGLIDFAATPLPDGRVLLTGGRRTVGGTPLDTALIARLDPIDGTVDVVATDHMSVPRAGHSATLLCDGTIFVSGGTADPAPAERYNPPALGRR
ncbi:MAG TPA: hypothetical protein VFQ65_08095 [Kofleriaceae bacterium]|nr:hypothetical protein [Kofleriaceae bacterium]